MTLFVAEVMGRLPLATAVLHVLDVLCPPPVLQRIWDEHRVRCYDDVLTFGVFVGILRDALIYKDNTVHKQFLRLEAQDQEPADESNFYRKLGRMPADVSRALLAHSGASVAALMPDVKTDLPASLDAFELLGVDGKTVKHLQHRLLVTRMVRSRIVGAKALVAMNLRTGIAVAMSPSLDGMVNELTLVPALIEQLHASIPRPMLVVCDRQFDGYDVFAQFTRRAGDRFVIRIRNSRSMPLAVIHSAESSDPKGRVVRDESVRLTKTRQVLRRITLERDAEAPVTLMTDLTDATRYPAVDLLALYKRRWDIEQLFQQITQTFELGRLIGGSAKATLMQFAFCLVIYNAMQLLRAWLADGGGVLASTVSMYYLFDQARNELCAWRLLCDGQWQATSQTPTIDLKTELARLLRTLWHPKRYGKQPDKAPRKPNPKTLRLHGDHTSIHRLQHGQLRTQ